MRIKSIKLKNFQSYYSENNMIEFTSGLNVVTGSIASGKSKLFDAFYWTLNDMIFITGKDWVKSNTLKAAFINDKAKFEAKNIGDLIETFVEIVVSKKTNNRSNKEIDFIIRRQLLISRKNDGFYHEAETWKINPNTLSVEFTNPDNSNFERKTGLEAVAFIEELFPAKISPYIWFQGEALDKLIDFNSKGTIRRAIDYLSYVPLYKIMKDIINQVDEKIDRKKITELRKLSTNKIAYDRLTKEIEEQRDIIKNNKIFIEEKELKLKEYTDQLEKVETALAALSEFPVLNEEKNRINSRIHEIGIRIEDLDIDERKRFTSSWMLKGFEPFLKDAEKILIEYEDYRQSLIDKVYKLPDDVPGDVYIKKMLQNEICLVCNRPAKKESEAYKNIEAKLNRKAKPEYLTTENEELYRRALTYKNKLSNIFRNNSSIKEQIIAHKKQITLAINERNSLKDALTDVNDKINTLYTTRGIDVSDGAKSYRTKNNEYKTLNETIRNLARKIEVIKASITTSLLTIKENSESLEKIKRTNVDVNVIEEEIARFTNYLGKKISNIEQKEYEKLISLIESEANLYFLDITSVNNTIDGNIMIDRDSYRVLNVDDSGRELENYNTGHYTLMKMCIINAIISLTNDYKEEAYPFITDAPTSNLNPEATYAYLRSISNTFEQSIVITKDISENEIEQVKNLDYISSLFQLKIINNSSSDKMNREEAFTQISNLKN